MSQAMHGSAKVGGIRQLRRALRDGFVRTAYLAKNADPFLTEPLRELCREGGVPVENVPTMAELGKRFGIQVGAAAAGILRDT